MPILCFGDDGDVYSDISSGYHSDSSEFFSNGPTSRFSFSTTFSNGSRLKRAVGKLRRQLDRIRSSVGGLTATVPPPFRCFGNTFVPLSPSAVSFVTEDPGSDAVSDASSDHPPLKRAFTRLRGSIERLVVHKEKLESRCSNMIRLASLSPRLAKKAWQRKSTPLRRSNKDDNERRA